MKKTSLSKSAEPEMLPEYRIDYSQARTNRFAGKVSQERLVVLLDPEVSQIFKTPESVNAVLRALVTALPKATPKKPARKHKNAVI